MTKPGCSTLSYLEDLKTWGLSITDGGRKDYYYPKPEVKTSEDLTDENNSSMTSDHPKESLPDKAQNEADD